MTQLSPTSKKTLQHITAVLKALERVIEFIKTFLLKKCPLFVQNIITAITVLKDITTFIPSVVYKSLLFVVVFSILYRKIKRWRQRRLSSLSPKKTLKSEKNLQNLGQQYLVKDTGIKSVVGNARTQIDSLDFQFINIDESKPRDFRDIVFFDLMKSYREVSEEEEYENEK